MTVPLAVVSSVTQTNGAASGTEMMSYSYKNLQLVQQGRGSLGFSYSKVTNSTTGVSTETEVTHKSPQSYYPLTTVETQTIGNSTAIRTSHYSASFIGGTRKVYHSLLSTTETDHDGYATVTAYEYDSLHNSVPLSVTVTGFDGSTTQTIYASYVLKGGAYLPQSVSQVDSQPGSNPFTDQTWHEYDGKGRETLCVQHYGKPEALTTAYTYNSSGNLSQTVTTGTDIETVTNTYEWDNSRRFITRSVERGYIVNEYTYDLWGNVLTETDKTRSACPETTTHTYDGWGHPATVTSPLGITTTYSRGWGTTQAKRYYVLEQGQGRPFVKTWYDACGREVLTESVGLLGVTVSAATAYNAKGLVSQRQAVEGSRTVTEAFNYDARGRLLNSSVTPGPTTCYSYNNRTVTTTTNGRSRTTTTDSRGNIVLSTDPVSSVRYVYDPCGKPSAAISEGDSVCMEYDGAGRRTKLTDPDAGIVTTTYDALGRVKTQRDTNGVLTTYTYNSRGQLTQESTGSTTTYYTYGTGTADNGLLLSVSRDGNTTSYQYDSHARITQEQRTYAWSEATRTMGYAYNSLGQLSERTFPGNLTITYLYDNYGNKWRMFCGTKQLYQISNYNGSSMTEDLGLHIIRTTSFDALGHVTNCQTRYTPDNSVIATQAYTYDNNTGNMTSRTVSGATEYFNYDSMDRLVSVRKNNVVTDSVRYDACGNITYRKGVGSYSYDDDRPHAVSQIENTGGTVPVTSGNMGFTYDAMNKLCMIEDYEAWTGQMYNNGPDRQRWESDNKLYFGDYEETYPNGIENTADRRFTYLDGGTLCITDVATGQKQFYYMVTDHLGSILNIVTEDGGTYYSATYDAWGRQTFVDDFLGFDRGYCGHEMLNDYGLIHMNGRLYDPMMGRFLSPDNYVQEPDNSQNFNRYSYCFNNPLKFIDKNGEFAWLPVIIGAIAGTYSGGVLGNSGQLNPMKWNYSNLNTWGYMFSGGMVGGLSGSVGSLISSSGIPMANTLGLATSSLINSVGTNNFTGGQTPVSISLGAVSYDFSNKKYSYLFKRGNSKINNSLLALGFLANLSDLLQGCNPQKVDLVTEHNGSIGHSAIVNEGTETCSNTGDPNSIISVGPDIRDGRSWHLKGGTNKWTTHSAPSEKIWRHSIYVNMKSLMSYSNWLNKLEEKGKLIYSVEFSSCVTHTSIALNMSGVFNIGLHPYLLNAQMYLWEQGIRPWTLNPYWTILNEKKQ
jgi:RHS repeat-associated protein